MNSSEYFVKAKKLLPGGVNSPVRAFNAVGGEAVFFERAKGSEIISVEGDVYSDFILSWGAAILGHSHPVVNKAMKKQVDEGICFGMPARHEVQFAEYLCEKAGVEMLRFVNSGTEATMSAIRLARGFTKRDNIIKFDGCYHGHSDGLLVKAGSGGATFGVSDSLGVPKSYAKHTLVLPYNDVNVLRQAFEKGDIAAVILEPICGNMGVIRGKDNFLKELRQLCDEFGALLIFDEVMCGFRVIDGSSSKLTGVEADLYCFGKIIGGGIPVGAFGGKRRVMNYLSPSGGVYQAGTLSGNPLAMIAGLTTMKFYYYYDVFTKVDALGLYLEQQVGKLCEQYDCLKFVRVGSMFTLFFHNDDSEINNFNAVSRCDFDKFKNFFNFALQHKILLPPSQYEANFLSLTHTKEQLDGYVEVLTKFMEKY